MVLADTMAIFFVIVGLLLSFPSFWLLCCGLWPGLVDRAAQASAKGMGKSLLIGIPITVLEVFILNALGKLNNPLGNLANIGLLCTFLLFANIGASGIATLVGRRLPSPRDRERPWLPTLRGGLVLTLAYLLPVVGWLFILPLSLVIGFGSAVRGLFGFKNVAAKPLAELEAPVLAPVEQLSQTEVQP